MADWIIDFISDNGYLAVALLMLAENVFPPIPSELVMPFAGLAGARGELNVVVVVIAGTAGSVAGAVLWYLVGRRIGEDRLRRWSARHGRWMTLSPADIDKANAWFSERGHMAVFLGRLVPAVRTLISVPAGIAKMPLRKFLVWSTLGSLLWTSALASLGFFLGDHYEAAGRWIDWAAKAIVAAAVLGYAWRVATFRRKS